MVVVVVTVVVVATCVRMFVPVGGQVSEYERVDRRCMVRGC